MRKRQRRTRLLVGLQSKAKALRLKKLRKQHLLILPTLPCKCAKPCHSTTHVQCRINAGPAGQKNGASGSTWSTHTSREATKMGRKPSREAHHGQFGKAGRGPIYQGLPPYESNSAPDKFQLRLKMREAWKLHVDQKSPHNCSSSSKDLCGTTPRMP